MPNKTSTLPRAKRQTSRTIRLTGNLDAAVYRDALAALKAASGGVKIIFRTHGGDVLCDEFYELADAIYHRGASLVGVADTEAVSAAGCLFLQCGDRRVLPGTVIQINGPYATMRLADVIAGRQADAAEHGKLQKLHDRFSVVLRRGLARTKVASLADQILLGERARFSSETVEDARALEDAGIARLVPRRSL